QARRRDGKLSRPCASPSRRSRLLTRGPVSPDWPLERFRALPRLQVPPCAGCRPSSQTLVEARMDQQPSTVAERPATLNDVLLAYSRDAGAGGRRAGADVRARPPPRANAGPALPDARGRLSVLLEPLRVPARGGPAAPAAPPVSFGGYEIERELGKGG